MKSHDVVAYVYQADQYHPGCLTDAHTEIPVESWQTTEDALREWAEQRGIQREYESTFDSDDFPKVIFADEAEGICGHCGEDLL